MKEYINDDQIDVIVTSPPYYISVKYSTYYDAILREEYLSWMDELMMECKRTLNEKGHYFLIWDTNRKTHGSLGKSLSAKTTPKTAKCGSLD